jgi:hypothetical protein
MGGLKVIVAVVAVALGVIDCRLAGAADVETSTGVVCTTQRQVERFVALNDADPLTAIRAVNAEESDPAACAAASLAFLRGDRRAVVRKNGAAFQIVEILVVGKVTAHGVHPVRPAIYFSLFKIDERQA